MKSFQVTPLKQEALETLASNNLSPLSGGPEYFPEAQKLIRPSNFLQVVQETVAQAKQENQNTKATYNFEVHGKQLLLAKTSLWIFTDQNRFRKALVWFVESTWFNIGITAIIFLNTVFLALTDFETRINPNKESQLNDVVNIADLVFSSIFIVEFAIKVIAMGFLLGKGTYLRNGWNMIDFVVVITSIVNIIPSIPNINSLRPIRAIKPLRTINTVKGMKVLVGSLVDSLPALANVSIFLLFLIVVYSILGVQLFSGAFEQRCRLTPEPLNGVWLADVTNRQLCGSDTCPVGTYCGTPAAYDLPKNWDEVKVPELLYGIPNFDTIFNATLTVFQSVTTEGWSVNMYMLSHAYSPAIVIIYFCSLTVFGAFFALNLILAVINDSFHKSRTKEQKDGKSLGLDSRQTLTLKREISNKQTNDTEEQSQLPPSVKSLPVKVEEKNLDENIGLDDSVSNGSAFNSIQRFKMMHGHINKKSGFSTDRSAAEKPILDRSMTKDKEKIDNPDAATQVFAADEHLNQRTQNNRLFYYMHKIVLSKIFLNAVVLLIILNTVILALSKYPEDKDLNSTLELINTILTFVFTGELLVKLVGLGFVEYAKDRFNLFDALIVVISLVEFATDTVLSSSAGLAVITGFRCFRLVRIFKLARSWTGLRNLLTVLGKTLKDIKNFSILVLIFIIISALLGEELFAYKAMQDNGDFPRINFNTFLDSLLAVFALLTGEAWNYIMYDHYRTVGQASAIYFVIVVLLGNYILLKLFLAILINNFQGFEMSSSKTGDLSNVTSSFKVKKLKIPERFAQGPKHIFKNHKPSKISSVSPFFNDLSLQKSNSVASAGADTPKKSRANSIDITSAKNLTNRRVSLGGDLILRQLEEARKNDPLEKALEGNAFFILSSRNILRRMVARIVLHPLFENFILVAIIFSSICLALDSPTEDPSQSYSKTLSILDKITTSIFTFEMITKLIVHGVIINGSQSYLRSPWNILDSIVVVISLVSMGFDLSGGNQNIALLNQLKILRTLRVLRPLKLISKNEGLKLVLNSILAAIPSLANLIIICLIFFLLFGVVGVNFFKGQFYSCDLTNVAQASQSLVVTKQDCMDYGGDWVNSDANFDNVLQSILTLFQLATTEGWLDIMARGVDSVGIDLQPVKNANKAWALFFVLFIIVGSFFVLNLFASVVVDTFNREKDRLGGISFLTKDQQSWIHQKLAMVNLTPYKHEQLPKNKLSTKLRAVTDKKSFEIFVMLVIFLNMIIFALHWDRQSDELNLAFDITNYVLLGFFTLEAIAKIIGHGKSYFKSGWNIFDFIIILASLIALIIDKASTVEGVSLGSSTSVIRTFRVGRIFRLINKAKSLRTIFNTIIITLPALANIGGLLLLVLFIYASLGNSLFAYTRIGDAINSDVNFQTFGQSFLTLFKISTGENWNSVFYICSRSQQANYACNEIESFADFQIYGYNDCGSGTMAVFYFISFQLIFTFILLNLFIAIILEAFNQSKSNEDAVITDKEYEHFKEIFKKYDLKGKGLIPEPELDFLLQDLEPPLLDPAWKRSAKQRSKFIMQAELPVYQFSNPKRKYYQFHDLLFSLSRRVMQQEKNLHELEDVPNNIVHLKQIEKLRGNFTKKIPGLLLHQFSSSEIRAGTILLSWAQTKLKQKEQKKPQRKMSVMEKVTLVQQDEEDAREVPIKKEHKPLNKNELHEENLNSLPLAKLTKVRNSHANRSALTLQEELDKDFGVIHLNDSAQTKEKQSSSFRGDMSTGIEKSSHLNVPKNRVPRQTLQIKEGLAEELENLEVISPANYDRRSLLKTKGDLKPDLTSIDLDNQSISLKNQRIERSIDSDIKGLKSRNLPDEGLVESIDWDSKPNTRTALASRKFKSFRAPH